MMNISGKIQLIALVVITIYSSNLKAINNDECSIWLCLPTGFPSGCGKAKSAFKKRIKKGKSPLPSLSSCIIKSPIPISNGSEMSSNDGIAAYIPEHQECLKWVTTKVNKRRDRTYCAKEVTVPTRIQKGSSCRVSISREGDAKKSSPAYCTQTIRYVDVYMDGLHMGDTYYFDQNGNKLNI